LSTLLFYWIYEGAMQAKTLDAAELKRVLGTIALRRYATRDRAMVLMTFYAGMRIGEVVALKQGDVLEESGAIRKEIRLRAEQTKGDMGRRVFISERLRKELASYAGTLQKHSPDLPFFPTQKCPKRGFTPNTAAQMFLQIYQAAGIDGASSHSGRRTFLTQLAQRGIGVRVLMSLAGHKSISVTQRYLDVNDDMQRNAVELL
jgi:integrase/recombinase XerD